MLRLMKNNSLILLLLLLLHCGLSAQHWQSKMVQFREGMLIYPSDADMNRIPDFSHAGYQGGLHPIPQVPTEIAIQPIQGDNTAHIQRAIDQVAELPFDSLGYRGAVQLSPGVYEVHGTILLNSSGVVLRGEGDK